MSAVSSQIAALESKRLLTAAVAFWIAFVKHEVDLVVLRSLAASARDHGSTRHDEDGTMAQSYHTPATLTKYLFTTSSTAIVDSWIEIRVL